MGRRGRIKKWGQIFFASFLSSPAQLRSNKTLALYTTEELRIQKDFNTPTIQWSDRITSRIMTCYLHSDVAWIQCCLCSKWRRVMPANLKDPFLTWNCNNMSTTTNNNNNNNNKKNIKKNKKNKCLIKQESWSTYHNIPLKKLMGVAIDALPLRFSVEKFGGIEQVRSLHRWQQVREDLKIGRTSSSG